MKKEYKIALVDDKERVREAFKEVYGNAYPIIEASTGKDGEEIIKREKNNLLLMVLDLEMPPDKGREVKKVGQDLAKLCNDLKIPHLIVTQYFHGGNITRLYAGYSSYMEDTSFEVAGVKEDRKTWKSLGELCLKNTSKKTLDAISRYIERVGKSLRAYKGIALDVLSLSVFATIYESLFS